MFPFLCTPILVIPLLAQRPFKESNAYNKRLSICSGACPFYSSIPAAGTKRRSAPASPFCPMWGTNTVEINPAVRRICFSLLAGFYCKQGTSLFYYSLRLSVIALGLSIFFGTLLSSFSARL